MQMDGEPPPAVVRDSEPYRLGTIFGQYDWARHAAISAAGGYQIQSPSPMVVNVREMAGRSSRDDVVSANCRTIGQQLHGND